MCTIRNQPLIAGKEAFLNIIIDFDFMMTMHNNSPNLPGKSVHAHQFDTLLYCQCSGLEVDGLRLY